MCVCVFLQVVGLYRLCGSAAVKKELREAFERDSYGVELCENTYPDVNVITGKPIARRRRNAIRLSAHDRFFLRWSFCRAAASLCTLRFDHKRPLAGTALRERKAIAPIRFLGKEGREEEI